jgi:hypothetical protein
MSNIDERIDVIYQTTTAITTTLLRTTTTTSEKSELHPLIINL